MKCVIWDLDETLWEGTIYHGETVKLKPETKEVLKQLDKLGIIQYVCSHNKFEPAYEKIVEFGLNKYFKGYEIGITEEKDKMVTRILKKEHILPIETLFIDDTGLQRETVRLKTGCHTDYEKDLFRIMKYFDTDRLISMNQQRDRTCFEDLWVGTKRELLEHIKNKITIKDAEEGEIFRITNLANRTNELNTARNRYTEEQITKLFKSKEHKIIVAYLSDKFGDYGLIGEVIIDTTNRPLEWMITDLCVSCRTMGRGVGRQLLENVIEQARMNNIRKVRGYVIQNDDNFRMGPLFIKSGFKQYDSDKNAHYYEVKI